MQNTAEKLTNGSDSGPNEGDEIESDPEKSGYLRLLSDDGESDSDGANGHDSNEHDSNGHDLNDHDLNGLEDSDLDAIFEYGSDPLNDLSHVAMGTTVQEVSFLLPLTKTVLDVVIEGVQARWDSQASLPTEDRYAEVSDWQIDNSSVEWTPTFHHNDCSSTDGGGSNKQERGSIELIRQTMQRVCPPAPVWYSAQMEANDIESSLRCSELSSSEISSFVRHLLA